MNDFQTLATHHEDNLGWVRINRPKKLNALNDRVLTELAEAFESLRGNEKLRGIFVTGSGDNAFVAGADIGELKKLKRQSGQKASEKGKQVFQYIEDMPVPVMALINGYALGGGAELAMACHVRIASEKAIFGLPEVGLGLIPGYGGTQRLPRLIGRTRALEMILTGQPIQADKALDFGLVNRVVAHDQLEQEARGLMNSITNNAPLAVSKALAAIVGGESDQKGYERESELFGRLCQTEDADEGLSAFLEDRNPDFKGH